MITQSVKDVVQSLVDDDLVSKDKIGTSVSRYCLVIHLFPSHCLIYISILDNYL